MTEETKGKKCKCCLGLGAIVLVLGVVLGVMSSTGFGLIHILAIIVGVGVVVCGLKGSKFCKCCGN